MKVLIAGASGAIGRPLIRCLRENRHTVTALVRSPESSRTVAEAGAEPVIADALDAAAVQEAVVRVRPDAVINELTALPRHYTPVEMAATAERDRTVRIEGNANLLAALGATLLPRHPHLPRKGTVLPMCPVRSVTYVSGRSSCEPDFLGSDFRKG